MDNEAELDCQPLDNFIVTMHVSQGSVLNLVLYRDDPP